MEIGDAEMDGDGGGADQRRWLRGARHRPPDLEPCFSGLGVVAVAIEDGGALVRVLFFLSSVPFLLGFHENFARERPIGARMCMWTQAH